MIVQHAYNDSFNIKVDLINKFVLKNYYNKKLIVKQVEIKLPKTIFYKIKNLSFKKSEFILNILIIFYFLFSVKPWIKYVSSNYKLNEVLLFKNSISIKKSIYCQVLNYFDLFYSNFFFYTFSLCLKYIFMQLFKSKKNNIFFFKVVNL